MKRLCGTIFVWFLTILVSGCTGLTSLNESILLGENSTAQKLIENGADVNEKDDIGFTPLCLAASKGQIGTVKLLLDKGANVNLKTNDGSTALVAAAAGGYSEIVRLLLEKGAKVNEGGKLLYQSGWTALILVAAHGDIETVKLLLDRGADVNLKTSVGWTALNQAAGTGKVALAKLLLERGAYIDAKGGTFGLTALSTAALNGHRELVRYLLDNGASVDDALDALKKANADFASKNKAVNKVNTEQAIAMIAKYAGRSEFSVAAGDLPQAKQKKEAASFVKSDIDEIPAMKVNLNKNAYAIVIGIENYRQKLPKADYATHDAQTVTEYLTKVMGYSEENVVTLTNDHAALGDFVKYFEKWLPNNVENGSTVLVYYSGHGAPNPKTGDAYLVPYDGDPSFIDQTGYSLKRLYESLNKLQAKEIIVALDSCFSGAGGRSVIAKGARPLVMNLQNNTALSKNMTVLSASSGDEISSTYDEKGHGLFTYFMLKGIKNEDVLKKDGSIAISDLFSYLKPQVERIARKQYNNEQTPQLIGAKK